MESIFTRTYRYRERKDKNNLENYLIENFSFCLENDHLFRKAFLSEIGFNDDTKILINTQSVHDGFGRPDIEIKNSNSILLIECKIESTERENQLKDYLQILKKSDSKNKYLIYLTKYYESKDLINEKENIIYENYKWWDIYNLIEDQYSPITKQLKIFLKEKNIAMDKNFKTVDLISLNSISGTISKMDEVIDSVKEYFEKSFGALSKQSSRSTRLKDGAYYNFKNIGQPFKFEIALGFMWWEDDENIYLVTRVWVPVKGAENKKIGKFFRNELIDWDIEDWDNNVEFARYKNVNEIVATKEEQIPELTSFLIENINILKELKVKNKEIFK